MKEFGLLHGAARVYLLSDVKTLVAGYERQS